MSEQNVNTISSQIDLDIKTATDVSTLIQDIDDLQDAVNELADSVAKVNTESKSFELKLSEAIKDSLNKMRNQEFKVDGSTIEKKLAETLADFVASRDVLIKSDNNSIDITPSAKFWNSYKKAIGKTLEDNATNLKLSDSAKDALNLNPAVKRVMKRIGQVASDYIDNDLKVEFDGKKDKVPKLVVGSTQMTSIMEGIADAIVDNISNPENIYVAGVPPMVIKAGSLQRVVDKIKESIGDIERYLNLDAVALKDIPKISPQLDQFDVKVQNLLKQVIDIQKVLVDLNPEIKPEQMSAVAKALNTLNSSVADGVTRIIRSVTGEIKKMPLDTINYGILSDSLSKLDNVVQESIRDRMAKAENDLMTAMGVAKANVNGKEVYLANMKSLNERIVEASKSAVNNISGDDVKLDSDVVKTVVAQLSKQFDYVAKTSMQQAVSEVITIFLSVNDDISKKFVELAKEYNKIALSIPKGEKAQEIQIPVDIKDIKNQFKAEILPVINEYIHNMKFKAVSSTSSKKDESIEIGIPKAVRDKIARAVSRLIEGQSSNILKSIESQLGTAPSDDVVSRVTSLVNSNVETITDTVVEKAKLALNSALGTIDQSTTVSASEKAQIAKAMSDQSSVMINQYTEEIRNAFGGVVEATATIQGMVNSMQKTVLQGVQLMLKSITFNTQNPTEIQLDIAVERALKEVQKAVINSIKTWKYDVTTAQVQSDAVDTLLSDKITKMQETIMKNVVKSTLQTLNQSTSTSSMNNDVRERLLKNVDSVSKKFVNKIMKQVTTEITTMLNTASTNGALSVSPSVVDKLVTPLNDTLQSFMASQMNVLIKSIKGISTTTRFNTSSLHSDIRKRLADELETTVKQFTTTFPTMEGDSDLNLVMRQNIQYLVDKFNDAVLTNTTSSMKELQQAIKTVTVETDTSVATMLGRKMNKLQSDINKKVKEMLKAHFDLLTEQIKNMKIYPVSVGYTPPAKVVQAYGNPSNVSPRYGSRGTGSYNARDSVAFSSRTSRAPFNFVSSNNLNGYGYNPGGDTRSFSGAVVNTMRYMTAGMIMGAPMMALQRGFQATKEFDYNMTKAQQNFLMKDPDMKDVAKEVVLSSATESELKALTSNTELLNETIERTASDLKRFAREGSREMVTALANAFNQSISDASMAYSVASRNIDNPYDAQLFTKEVLKLKAVEEMDIETSALGLQSIQAQWGLDVADLEKATNMLIKTATLSSVTAEDLLETQSTSGSLFMNNLAGMTKGDALATSFALSSLFTQSTAKSGSEGGTYFKTVLEKPYESGSAEVLEKLSQYEGYENLNPYKEDGVTRKDYLELLGAIIDATDTLSDKGKTNLFEELFPGRYTGSATAIVELVSNMKEELKQTTLQLQAEGELPQGENISAYDTMKAYIDKISSATEDEIMTNVAGMQTTWDMQIQRTQSIAETLSMNLFEDFKSDFSIALTYLNSFLRTVQNNTDVVTGIVGSATKVAVAVAGSHLLKLGSEKLDELSTRRDFKSASGKMFFSQSDADSYDDYALQLREAELKHRINDNQIETLKAERNDTWKNLEGAYDVRNTLREEYNSMVTSGADATQLANKENEIKTAETNIRNLTQEVDVLDGRIRSLKSTNDDLLQDMSLIDAQMKEMTGTSMLLDVKFDQLELGLADAGIDTLEFNRHLNELQKEFKEGRLSINNYENELVELGSKAGLTKQETLELKAQIDSLNRSLATGRIDASQYAIELQRVRSSNIGSTATVAGTGGGRTANTSNSSLMTTMIATSAITGGATASTSTGALGRIGAKIATIPVLGTLFKSVSTALSSVGRLVGKIPGGSKVMSTVAKFGSKLGVFGKLLGRFGKAIPYIGTVLTAMEVVPNLLDGIMSKGNTLGENMQIQAQNAKKFSQSLIKIKESSNIIIKGLRMLMGLWDVVMNGINNLAGGNKMSFSESFEAWKKASFSDMSSDEFEQWVDENINYDGMAVEANKQLAKENLESIDPIRDASTGKINDRIENGSVDMTLEDMQTLVTKRTEGLNDKMSLNDNNAAKQRLNLLLQGYRESSDEVQAVIRENLRANNQILQETIDYLKEYLPKLADGSAKDYLMAQIAQLEVTQLQNQVDIQQSYESVYDNIMDKYNYKTSVVEAQYGIKESNAIISGYKDDSTVVKQVGIAKNRALINQINETQSQLQSALGRFSKGSEMYDKIWLQILQLEAEEKSLLATISKDLKEMGQKSTFNLPSGVTPITYWEAMTKNNTHKNMTVRAGDTNINITIDKMSGSEEDIEKMATTIDQVVKDATKNSTYAFDSNVKSGMGYSYYPHTRV